MVVSQSLGFRSVDLDGRHLVSLVSQCGVGDATRSSSPFPPARLVPSDLVGRPGFERATGLPRASDRGTGPIPPCLVAGRRVTTVRLHDRSAPTATVGVPVLDLCDGVCLDGPIHGQALADSVGSKRLSLQCRRQIRLPVRPHGGTRLPAGCNGDRWRNPR